MKDLLPDSLTITSETLPMISKLSELIPGGFFIYHAYGNQELITYNRYMLSLFGCSNAEEFEKLTGNSFQGIVHPKDYDITEQSILDQIAGKNHQFDHVKYRFIRKDGSIGMMDDYGHFHHSESFGDIYYVFVQDITEQYREEQLHKENIARIMALEDNFVSLYDADLETGTYECYVKNHLLSADNVEIMVNNGDFFRDTVKNAELVIYPEDRESLIHVLDREFIRNTLEKESSFDWHYRLKSDSGPVWAKLRFAYKDKEKTHVVVGVFNAQEEMTAKLREEQRRKQLIAGISGSESTYIVHPETDCFTVISRNTHLEECYPDDETYTQSITRYIETDVFEPDRLIAAEALCLQAILRHLETERVYSARYRDISSGIPLWFEMRAVRLSGSEILIGFSNRDAETIEQMIYEKMRENYFGLYYINIDAGLAQIIKTGHPEFTGEAGWTMPYRVLMQNIASSSDGETADFLYQISDLEYVKDFFTANETWYSVYKADIFEGVRWIAVNGIVLKRHEDGSPSVFALGFSLLDEEASEKEEAQLKLLETTAELEAQNHHNTVLNQIIKAGPWQFRFDAACNVIASEFSEECSAVLRNNVTDGEQWLSLIHPEDSARVTQSFQACLSDPDCRTPFDSEYRVLSTSGDYHWIHSAGRMRWNADGTGEFYGICIDIEETVRKREEAQKQLADALAMAESANKSKTAFLNNMSHDIRTPMNAIIGFTGLAAEHIDSKEQVRDYLAKIGASSNHLLSLINDVLDMSRIESGKMSLEEQPEDLTEILRTLQNIVQADIRKKQHSFTVETVNLQDETIICDKLRLNQILLNILSNSIKYTGQGGTISLHVTEKPAGSSGYARYEFRVRDNGIGMDKEYLKTIFDPFTRVKSSTVSGIQGTGLGMAITKNLVDMMGGSIDVRSEPGQGTEMTVVLDFRLPAAAEDSAPVREPEDLLRPAEYDFTGKKILLVEDNEMNREIATELLSEYGFILDTADDGDVAVEKVRQASDGEYDLILMDIQMPRMNGYEATRQIRALGTGLSRIPILAMTANAFEEDRRAALEAGMDEHIAKPIDIARLKETLARFL